MKRLAVLFFLSLTCTGATCTAPAFSSVPFSPSSINVKDHGAKGDGVADDTQAIQRAVNAATEQAQKWPVRVRHWNHLANGILDNPHPEVVFPAGTYKISNPIVFRRYSTVRGIGTAVIKQADPDKESFYFHGMMRSSVENLHFDGGKTQLRFYTANIGTARIWVQRCTFANSTGYAVECRSYTQNVQGLDNTRPWAPYTVQWVGGLPQLTANNADNLTHWYNSTSINLAHCRFENVMHAANLSGDTVVVRDSEITTNPQMEGAILTLNGKVHLYRIKGLAHLDASKHQYWIERTSRGPFSLHESEFDTDAPQGICLLRAGVQPVASAIVLENSRVKSAGSREGAILWIARETQPNIISINGVREISGQPVKAVTWEQTPDAATLEKIKDQPKDARSDYIYKLQIAGNSPSVENGTPPIFAPLSLPPVPVPALEETFVPELSWDYNTLETQAIVSGKIFQASDYGVDQDPKTDDTAAIEKLFDAVARQEGALVIFPTGVFTLSDTIQLPSSVVVRGAGVASFVLNNPQKDLFTVGNAGTIAFKNCDFNGGRNGFNIHSENPAKARIAFDNCSFYEQEENAIQVLAGTGKTGERNQTELWVQGGIFASMHAVTTNAAHSQLAGFWAMNDPRLDDDAFIKNLGGAMRIQAMLGNPVLWQGKRSEGKAPANITDWQYSKNTRWIDNWGKLYSLDNRFGGEAGGMCNIVNRSASGTLYIGGGMARFNNGVTRKAMLYLETIPQRAVVQNISSAPLRVEEGWTVMNSDGSDGKRRPQIVVSAVPAP